MGEKRFFKPGLNSLSVCEREESEISINDPREKKVKTKGGLYKPSGMPLSCIINTGPSYL